MMGCEDISTNIPLLLAEELSPDERMKMLHHMEECTQCRREMEEIRRTWNLLDQWEIEEPSAGVKARVMAAVREDAEVVHLPWWASLHRSSIFQTVAGALGIFLVIYLIFPYDTTIGLCETNILNGGLLSLLPKGPVYFMLGLLYGLVPVSLSAICFSKSFQEKPLIKGLGAGFISSALLVPFFIVQCPPFTSGLIFIMALGIVTGALSGGTGTLWILNRVRI